MLSKGLRCQGEIGAITSNTGCRATEADAYGYVWGYTIADEMTTRGKQFFIGPVAASKDSLQSVLKVETHANGELRQSLTAKRLILSIPTLIKTLSECQTLQPGDVIFTGTPAGVGIAFFNWPFRINNLAKTLDTGVGLAKLNGKQLN
ncbi:bifunctional 4-hydroxyphenylacetate degradation enzyme [Fusarium bulbicola]|nr:bifunctional 4-hydroxyphenylacetate degradation enzyme [Fusarium bulbicola]